MPYRLGLKERQIHQHAPHWSALRRFGTVIVPPPTKYWSAKLPLPYGMMLNDRLGDCVCACIYHNRQVLTFNAQGKEDTEPDAEVLATYEGACGYAPSEPESDVGCNIQNTLEWWMSAGIPLSNGMRDKLVAFIQVDHTNPNDIHQAIYECGSVIIGLNVPQYVLPADGSAPPSGWTLQPNADNTIIGGHCVNVTGYDTGYVLMSWGGRYWMGPGFWNKFVTECWAIVDLAWVASTGKTPLGLSVAQLEAIMSSWKALH